MQAQEETVMSSVQASSGPGLDLPARQRSRDGVSSTVAAHWQAHAAPDDSSAASAVDGSGPAPLPPVGTSTAPVRQQLLTADEVAVMLRVPRSLVYALARRGELPTVRIGERYVRFRATTIERWIQSQEAW